MIVQFDTVITPNPTKQPVNSEENPLLFVVWIDDNCGHRAPNWEIDNPPPTPEESMAQALTHAAKTRSMGYPSVLMLPGQSPRLDGSIDPQYRK